MSKQDRERLRAIRTFPQLVVYLRDELDWPIEAEDFEDLTFDYGPDELDIDVQTAAKIQEIKQLRPLVTDQPWGIFFVKFEPKQLPVVALRRILSRLALKKRPANRRGDRAAWNLNDLLFISSYGQGDQRQISFAHFTQKPDASDLPTLKVLGWDDADTALHLDHTHHELKEKLTWPADESALDDWRTVWSSAFTLRHREVITTSKDLAIQLADLARRIRKRANRVMAIETEKGPIRKLHKAFQQALIQDLSMDDFADMYAQTIAYGLLAARVSRPMGIVSDNLADMVPITNPFLKEMLSTFLTVGGRKAKIDFDELGIQDVVDLLNSPDTNIEAVLRDFGNRTQREDPVVHFYELFLGEYDRQKKVQRGVFYTPQPVVSYIVRSVHELLQTDFGLEDGLASTITWGQMIERHPEMKLPMVKVKKPKSPDLVDEAIDPQTPFVQILDPATGTATFLVEVVDVIHKTMLAKWKKEGHLPLEFPRLWDQYVPKHLLPRLHGYELMMAPYAIAHMKIGLKLYETGYRFGSSERARVYLTNTLEPPHDFSDTFEQMAPALAHEAQAVNEVKHHRCFTVVIGNPPYSVVSQNASAWITSLMHLYKEGVREERNIQPLSDDYVKFFRFAQYCIETTGCGILAYITNHTYLSGIIHRGMRQELLKSFNSITIVDAHGSALLGLVSPNGELDENVFDIQQGVAIARCACLPNGPRNVRCCDLWGARDFKYRTLLSYMRGAEFLCIEPSEPYFFFARQIKEDESYGKGVAITELFQESTAGFVSGKDETLIAFDHDTMYGVVCDLADRRLSDEHIHTKYHISDTKGWPVTRRRRDILKDREHLSKIRSIAYRPFDNRFTFYSDFLQRARYSTFCHLLHDNIAIITSRLIKGESPAHVFVARHPVEKILLSPKTSNNAFVFPLYLYPEDDAIIGMDGRRSSLSRSAITRMGNLLGLTWTDSGCGSLSQAGTLGPEDVLHYTYAVLHSPEYRRRYAEFLKIDFPRLPLTSNLDLFRALTVHGSELVGLHLMESPGLDKLITNWRGSLPSTMVEKASYANATVWIDKAMTEGFRGVPEAVWQFHIGGYQVCEKWLKDRKGRRLSKEDIAHYQKIVVALAETIKIMAQIDKTIEAHGGWPGAFITDPKKLEGLQSKKA